MVKDPCGFICFLVTYGCIIYTDYCIIVQVLLPTLAESLWGTFHVVAFNTFIFLMVFSHMKASFSDPGKVPLPQVTVDFSEARRSSRKRKGKTNDEWTVCKHCEMFRPPRSHHCRVCNRCIKRMDHHCPWINNCVGERNQKYFLLFLIYTSISSLYAILLAWLTWSHQAKEFTIKQKENRRFHIILLFVICVFFCLFCFCILYEQLHSIFTDMTTIEQIQSTEQRSPKSKLALLTEVCGGNGSYYSWMLPCNLSQADEEYRRVESYEV